MKFAYEHLEILLRLAAVTQFGIALLNLSLIKIMKWKPDLERMPLLIREVFRIHAYFISVTLGIFAVLTWFCVHEIATAATPLAIGFAVSIAIFWAIRSAMQWLYYSPIHWRGNPARTVIHWTLFIGYGALATVYLLASGRNFI